jgi:hypothetical protein
MFHRFLSHVAAISLLGLAGVSLGCGDSFSPSSPTPASAPITPANFVLRSVSPSSGPTIGGDFIRLVGEGFQSGATVLLDGVAARVTKVTGATIDARTLAHASGPVDVVVTNPDGQAGR